jgi:hypothetical protein
VSFVTVLKKSHGMNKFLSLHSIFGSGTQLKSGDKPSVQKKGHGQHGEKGISEKMEQYFVENFVTG